MAGWTVMPINRVMTCDGTSNLSLITGTPVTGYPLVNLNDPDPSLQAKITPTAGAIGFLFDFQTTAAFSTDPACEIGGIGLSNFNGNGCTFQLLSHSSNVFGSATSQWGPYTLTSNVDYIDLFATFTANYARYWWLTISGAPTPFTVGAIGLGPTIELGYPMRPSNFGFEEVSRPTLTAGGHLLPNIGNEPLDVKTLYFANPGMLTKAKIYDKSSNSSFGASYNTLWRSFRHRRQRNQISGIYNGLTGASAPIFYHEGDGRGRSTAGRPGFYGYWDIQGIGEDQSRDRSVVRVKITDATPKGVDVQPAI